MSIKQVVRSVVPARTWDWLRVLRVRLIIKTSPRHWQRHSFGGFKFDVEIGDPIARGWYDHDCPVLPEITFLQQYGLQPGATVFDIGAHQCVIAMMLAKVVEPGLVVAVEGNGYNAAVGKRNKERNAINNLEVIHGAGGCKSGEVNFSENWNGQVNLGSPEVGNVKVPCYTIDELSRRYGTPQVLFIDVEGFEGEVLAGSQETLATFPDCFVEVHVGKMESYHTDAMSIVACFPKEHYHLFWRLDEEGHSFRQLHEGDPLPTVRFFLIAISKTRMLASQQS